MAGAVVTMRILVGSELYATQMYPEPRQKDGQHIYVELDDVELAALMSASGHITLVEEAAQQIEEIRKKGGKPA